MCQTVTSQMSAGQLAGQWALSGLLLFSSFGLVHGALANVPPATPAPGSWPMFRGTPSLSGVAPGSLTSALTLLWSFKTLGPVKSSAAVDQGRVYVGSDDQHVYCLDLEKGTTNWSFKTDGPIESSPLVLEGRVHIGSADGWVYTLQAGNGQLVWKYQTGDKILGSPNWLEAPRGGG